MSHFEPQTVEELAQIVSEHKTVYTDIFDALTWEYSSQEDRLRAHAECQVLLSKGEACRPLDLISTSKYDTMLKLTASQPKSALITRHGLSGIIDFQPENQVIKVQAGINLICLNKFLSEHGQTIPLKLESKFFQLFEPTLPQLYKYVESGSPHNLWAQHGTWRDWILGVKLVLADGSIVSSGASVVKNVTGFDLHRLIIGSRGSLGLLAELTLKTTPTSSLQKPKVEDVSTGSGNWSNHYHRTLASDWNELCEWLKKNTCQYSLDHAAHQAVYSIADGAVPPTFFSQIYQNYDEGHRAMFDSTTQRLMKRTKEIFDPTYKLNPGEFGFI